MILALELQLRLDVNRPGLHLPPSALPQSGSEAETEEDDPELALRIRDHRFISNAADSAWRAGAGAGIVGLPGLLLVERAVRARGGTALVNGQTSSAGGGSASIREASEDGNRVKWFSTMVAEVVPGSVAFYAGGC
jgi:hypothetical protein